MSQAQYDTGARDEPSGWVGWIGFAGVMMMIGGALNSFYGLVALFNDEWVVWGNRGAVYFDVTTWGWIHLIVGGIVFLCGIGVLTGNILARTVGVILASIAIITNFFFIPVYPFWSITVIVICALVIWALMAHGDEVRSL